MPGRKRDGKKLLFFGVVCVCVALAAYAWCYFQGSCRGQCVAVGYVVSQTCVILAAKIFLAMALAGGVVYVFDRR